MSPTKTKRSATATNGDKANGRTTSKTHDVSTMESGKELEHEVQKDQTSPKKRKQPPEKETRQGSRKSARNAPTAEPSQSQLLRYMLSDNATELCRPADEARDLASRENAKCTVTYTSSVLNPFQELVSAVVLSRPISHMLGLRTLRTIFNAPYEFNNAKAIQDAGLDKVHKALWDARTQHKAKTADQLSYLGDLVLEYFADEDDKEGERLAKVLASDKPDEALQDLIDKVKGLGPTGGNIFRRRVQWLWPAAYPFIDSRSSDALQRVGLPSGEDDLQQVIGSYWDGMDHAKLVGQDVDEKKRRALVVVLERATGADLEGKVEQLKEAAAKL
ncbi:uncharacterized protein J7T54_004691 [Emericellopsis cladophorae]|uniref:HhH-GPD domain-containing protein n=1 Tax=Emericellopsis cladophorae TaxID=2686198 RepID=A0A9Q0BGX4_9HYPO|nr:uncharacterized protein J7T54_004691 [Emericellopsis cladophorae]KAI6784145.1 hypothetical protein J7T54_004691 [Emericellopsis cladophorae]